MKLGFTQLIHRFASEKPGHALKWKHSVLNLCPGGELQIKSDKSHILCLHACTSIVSAAATVFQLS